MPCFSLFDLFCRHKVHTGAVGAWRKYAVPLTNTLVKELRPVLSRLNKEKALPFSKATARRVGDVHMNWYGKDSFDYDDMLKRLQQ